MRRITILLFLSVFCFARAMHAQAQAPKPDPELKKLSVFVGHWTYEGEYKPGPLGPGGKVAGEYTGQMILGGFFFQARWTEKGPAGETQGLDIEAYDPVNKNFVSNWYLSDGSRFSGVTAISEKTDAIAGKFLLTGKQYEFKDTLIFAADLMSVTERGEISADGKTWTPWVENKWTKTKPAPKK